MTFSWSYVIKWYYYKAKNNIIIVIHIRNNITTRLALWRWSQFCVLIGYPSGHDEPILPTRDSLLCCRKSKILWHNLFAINKSYIDQACLFFFVFLWMSTSSQSIKVQIQKELGRYAAILTSSSHLVISYNAYIIMRHFFVLPLSGETCWI